MADVLVDEEQLKELQNELNRRNQKNQQYEKQFGESSIFGTLQDENLIKWQLELDNILERIDHLLRGHELKFENGNLIWKESSNSDNALFNEYGVQEVLRILSMYLNRNTILSNYDEETIKWKVYDFGIEITDLIHNKYEEMGLTTQNKIKLYPIIVRELVDTIHSAYLRALNGGERQSLREARHVSQNISPASQNIPTMNTHKRFSLFKPTSWVGN